MVENKSKGLFFCGFDSQWSYNPFDQELALFVHQDQKMNDNSYGQDKHACID